MIEVVDPDPAWAALGAAACAELEHALPGVEHVGSTAVPGLAAKPIIDLMAPVTDLDDVPVAAIEAAGYRPGPAWDAPRLLFQRRVGERVTHNLHLVPASTWPLRPQRLLRDHLRDHPEAVRRYADLKRSVAGAGSLEEYTTAKTELIQELVDAARAERGLAPEPVWEQ